MNLIYYVIIAIIAVMLLYKLFEQEGFDFWNRANNGYVVNSPKKGETKLIATELAQNAGTSVFYINWTLPLRDQTPHKYMMNLSPVDGRGSFTAVFNETDILSPKPEETWGTSPITLFTKSSAVYLGERYSEEMVLIKDNERLQRTVRDLETKMDKKIDKAIDRTALLEKTTKTPVAQT